MTSSRQRHKRDKPFPQDGALSRQLHGPRDKGRGGRQVLGSALPWEQKTRKAGAYEAVLVPDGGCWPCSVSLPSSCWWPWLGVCARSVLLLNLLLLPTGLRWCCCSGHRLNAGGTKSTSQAPWNGGLALTSSTLETRVVKCTLKQFWIAKRSLSWRDLLQNPEGSKRRLLPWTVPPSLWEQKRNARGFCRITPTFRIGHPWPPQSVSDSWSSKDSNSFGNMTIAQIAMEYNNILGYPGQVPTF